MPQLPLMALLHAIMDLVQEFQALLGDADSDDAAIIRLAIAGQQATALQAIEHPRHIGGPRDQATAQVERGHCPGSDGTQQPQGVVLLRREAYLGKGFVFDAFKPIVGAPQVEKRFLLERIESLAGAGR